MLLIGLGLGQLMQTLTIASQNSVGLRDMGVATSSSTFFRQIGGTLGTAVLLSLLFTVMPLNIQAALTDDATLKNALNAAMTPTVAGAPSDHQIMGLIYDPIVGPIETGAQQAAHAAGVGALVQQGVPRDVADAKVPPAPLDFSQQSVRMQVIDRAAPAIEQKMGSSTLSGGGSAINDTSFLNNADPRLSKPFLVGFSASAVQIYWVAMLVVLVAFVLSWFFKAPPLRAKSALQEAADAEAAAFAEGAADNAKRAADTMGALVEPTGDPAERVSAGPKHRR